MNNWGVITTNRFKLFFGGVILCFSMSLIGCQQNQKSASNNNSQDLKVQPADENNNQNIVIPEQTPDKIAVNTPKPSPTPRIEPQATPSASPPSVVKVPQNPSPKPVTQSSPKSQNSISKALTEKLSPKPTFQEKIPKPENKTPNQTTSPKPVVQALKTAAKSPARRIAAASNTNVYRSQRLGVNFKYPKGFVIKEPQESGSSTKVVELWSVKDYQAIAKGKYQNTFSPGNMTISLEDNPQGLSLVEWVTNNDELGDIIPQSYDTHVVAGREAMSFRTDGLYVFQNLVLPSSDGKKVIMISLAKGDRNYQKVFNQVVSSLEIN